MLSAVDGTRAVRLGRSRGRACAAGAAVVACIRGGFRRPGFFVSSGVSMRRQHRPGGQPQRPSAGRRADGGDPVNQVLLTAAVILNAWRSMHPARRPGRARSWLVPSWPPRLLLSSYCHQLAAELAADSVLRQHVRGRLGIAVLSPEDAARLVDQAAAVVSHADAAGDGSGTSLRCRQLPHEQ